MTIEEQIAQLQAMFETLQPVKQAAMREYDLALAIFQPKLDALDDVCAQMQSVIDCIKQLQTRQAQFMPTSPNELGRKLKALPREVAHT